MAQGVRQVLDSSSVGRVGWLSAVKEARQRGTGYWYAYRKLGVGRRAEAIAVTARLRLLSPNL